MRLLYVGLRATAAGADGAIAWGTKPSSGLRFIHVSGNGDENEMMRITGKGFVGLGTSTPSVKLDVRGGILPGPTAQCDVARSGTIRRQAGRLEVCEGGSWTALLTASGDVIGALRNQDGANSGSMLIYWMGLIVQHSFGQGACSSIARSGRW